MSPPSPVPRSALQAACAGVVLVMVSIESWVGAKAVEREFLHVIRDIGGIQNIGVCP